MLVAGSSTAPGVAKDEPGSGNARGSCGMSGFMVCWENWLKVRAQRVLVNGATRGFGLCLVITGIPQSLALEPALFNTFISALDAPLVQVCW